MIGGWFRSAFRSISVGTLLGGNGGCGNKKRSYWLCPKADLGFGWHGRFLKNFLLGSTRERGLVGDSMAARVELRSCGARRRRSRLSTGGGCLSFSPPGIGNQTPSVVDGQRLPTLSYVARASSVHAVQSKKQTLPNGINKLDLGFVKDARIKCCISAR